MNDVEFQNAIVTAIGTELAFSRIVQIRTDRSYGRASTFVTLINLPAGKQYCGAEQQNNRVTIVISGEPTGDKVKAEQLVCALKTDRKLRAKTATPTKIADYVGAHIKALMTEVAPNFTHS